MSQLGGAQEAYKKARNEWAAQVLLFESLLVDYMLPGPFLQRGMVSTLQQKLTVKNEIMLTTFISILC